MEIKITPNTEIPAFFGRTLYDSSLEAMFFNWTASGFSMHFSGDRLEMDATAYPDDFPGEDKNLPWVAVLVDGQKEPERLIRLDEGRKSYLLFSAGQTGRHVVRVVKRSENSKGRIALHRLTLSGEPECAPAQKETRLKLEFIGDSITCGFGNAMEPGALMFTTALEDGLAAYPAVAAGLLGAEYQSICISGIPLSEPSDPALRLRLPDYPDFSSPPLAMETQYTYTDRYHQEKSRLNGRFTLWDFKRYQPDAIVLNLGTNDAFRMSVTGGGANEELHFQRRYSAFLQTLRLLNGSGPVIACTLGPMNYFLYDMIVKAAAEHGDATGDKRFFCMKYGAINPWDEGFGGLGHPNIKTHARMGHELADALKRWF